MELQCQLSHAEMREAFRMNLTWGFWVRALVSNLRALILLGIVFAAGVSKILQHDGRHWDSLLLSLGLAIALVAFYLFRVTYRIRKTAEKANAACDRVALDAQGLASFSAAGASSFTPWTQFGRWKEGKLVFTWAPQSPSAPCPSPP